MDHSIKILSNPKNTLIIFINGSMKIGGIETYIYKLAKYVIHNKAFVMLILHRKGVVDSLYDDVFNSDFSYIQRGNIKLEEVRERVKQWNISTIKIISFDMPSFAQGEKIKKGIKDLNIDTFIFIPHFKGEFIYLEENCCGPFKKAIQSVTQRIIRKMQNNYNILYFNQKHIDTLKDKYNICCDIDTNYFIPSHSIEKFDFDEERCIKLWQRKRFNIVSISRFEFPHKGYLIGLIGVYRKLKDKYPFITLTIGGYGPDQHVLENEILKLPEEIRKDVKLIGKVAPQKMKDFFDDANVNVSVAGCYLLGVKNGTLSIPARHYSYDCEVYGLSPEANEFAVSEKTGQNLYDLLEVVLNMPKDLYVKYCKESYESRNTMLEGSRNNIFNLTNKRASHSLSVINIVFIDFISILKKIKLKLKLIKGNSLSNL